MRGRASDNDAHDNAEGNQNDPEEEMDRRVFEWSAHWAVDGPRAACQYAAFDDADKEPLTPTFDQFKAAARAFSQHTAVGVDDIHPPSTTRSPTRGSK